MKKVFYNFLLFDGISEELKKNKVIVVDNGKIEKISEVDLKIL